MTTKTEDIIQDCMDKLARLNNSADKTHAVNAVRFLLQGAQHFSKKDRKSLKDMKNIALNIIETDVKLARIFSNAFADLKITKRESKAFDEAFIEAEVAMLEMRAFMDKYKD